MPSRSDNYEFVKGLGRGGFGIVELWRQLHGDEDLVVAKRVFVGDMTKGEVDDAKQEANILKKAKHPHIVRYIGSWLNRESEDLIILQEYYVGGDMSQLISSQRSKEENLSSALVLRWLAQLTHALQYCHRVCRLVHRDLKPSNLFLAEDHSSIHLGDFGIARSLGSTASLCQTFVGTQAYMSPEVTRMQSYGPKSDVWSYGAIIHELCTLQRLYPIADMVTLMHSIASPSDPPGLPAESEYPNELRNLCSAVLIKDPQERPSFNQLLQDHDLLRVAVLQFERDADWSDSLVPARDKESEFTLLHDDDSEKIIRIFRHFDYNGDGLIDREELAEVLHDLDPAWHAGMANLLLETIDINGDGRIEYSEFIEWIMSPKDEWDEVRQSMLDSSIVEIAEDLEPNVVTSDGRPHAIDQASFVSPRAPKSRLVDAAAKSRERLLGNSSIESKSATTANVEEAADVKDLVELTVRRRELESLLEQLPIQEPDLEALGSADSEEPAHGPASDVSSWSVPDLKGYVSAHGGSLLGISEKSELIDLCRELQNKERSDTAELDDATQRKAAVISTRLRCIKVMQDEVLDPVELTISLRQAKDLGLDEEPCVKALVGHSCRLGMHAEDVVNGELSTLRELEDAAEVLEAARHVIELLGVGEGEMCLPQPMLDQANQRLKDLRVEKKQVGIRCQCGPFFKTASVDYDASWEMIKEELAQRWDRPVDAFTFFWRNGPDTNPLDSEDDWQKCAWTQRRAAAIEVKATIDRSKVSQPRQKQKRKGKIASKKQKSGTDKVRTERPVLEKEGPAEEPRAEKTPEEKPASPSPGKRPGRMKRTLAGLAASSAPRAPSRAGHASRGGL